MSCHDSSAAVDRYQYSHDETATIRLYPSSEAPVDNISAPWSLNSRVLIESTSTLQSSTPLIRQLSNDSWDLIEGAMANGTPFSKQVLGLLSRYPLQRLLIRVGDAASSSGSIDNSGGERSDEQQMIQEERARGPSGTSILASFAHSSSTHQKMNDHEDRRVHYQIQYASLLRNLLDSTLFPPCGGPLDSLRVRKHGHSMIVSSPSNAFNEENHTNIQTVNVESFLAADASIFCSTGINSFLLSNRDNGRDGDGWGAAANNGACHGSDNWGLFDSLFSSSSGVTLSELLLGSSRDSTPWQSGNGKESNKRNSVWIDMQVSPACFVLLSEDVTGGQCSIKVTKGVSYRIAMPFPSQPSASGESSEHRNQEQPHSLNLSLGDLLLGHYTLEHVLSSEDEGWKAWYPCPLSDSSRIMMYVPTGYIASVSTDGFDGDTQFVGSMEFNVLGWKDGFIDLNAPWAQIFRNEKNLPTVPSSSMFGISRTAQKPLGISSSGTLVFVLRHDRSGSDLEQSSGVKVKSLDVIPGTLIKPRMRTLRMALYQGDGAGGSRFVPPISIDNHSCDSLNNQTDWCNSHGASAPFGSSSKAQNSFSDLQDYKLTLYPDGTILLERTVILPPDSSLWMMVDFDEAYLPFQKLPADANRGVDVVPCAATFTLPSAFSKAAPLSITLFTPSLLLLPPVPDMSMPFNVISLSCTLWAFVLGSLLNILVRRGTESVKRELTGEKEKRMIDKLREKFKAKVTKLRKKLRRGDKGTMGSTVEARKEAIDEQK
ncbi:hypothetical protein ACHAXA_008374 [Cyclostephanos tholiformis]|uniref:GPI transamidase component PIG-T n=1 Tax=Cyclostephanos tholiformis TaxID=382380 RepID=A0ABD3R4G6_9STRA